MRTIKFAFDVMLGDEVTAYGFSSTLEYDKNAISAAKQTMSYHIGKMLKMYIEEDIDDGDSTDYARDMRNAGIDALIKLVDDDFDISITKSGIIPHLYICITV